MVSMENKWGQLNINMSDVLEIFLYTLFCDSMKD